MRVSADWPSASVLFLTSFGNILGGSSEHCGARLLWEWYDDILLVVMSATHDGDSIRNALSLGATGSFQTARCRPCSIALVASDDIYIPAGSDVAAETAAAIDTRTFGLRLHKLAARQRQINVELRRPRIPP
jgi:hypothetical protein